MNKDLLVIGVMTGNSMDAVDAVLTRFSGSGEMEDLAFYSLPYPRSLYADFQKIRAAINAAQGDVAAALADASLRFEEVHETYIELIAQTIRELIHKAHNTQELTARFGASFPIDLIGNHGQTVAHYPPSIVKDKTSDAICTVQLGDGALLADKTGIPVVFDFRSDDVMNGGEGAPLAPQHNKAMAVAAQQKGAFPIAFCNAGNTGNIALITTDQRTNTVVALGWDTGPFNYFTDQLCQKEKATPCDKDGQWGKEGTVNCALLQILFDKAIIKNDGSNYLLAAPPKSSDGQWYKLPPELTGEAPVAGKILSFADRLRTAQYFSAYIYFHTLSFVPEHLAMPRNMAVFGGGWRNPVCFDHFRKLLAGDFSAAPVLPDHQVLFETIADRLKAANNGQPPLADWSSAFGFDGTSTEARIFAHAAVCWVQGVPFSYPESTGCATPTIGGILRYPHNNPDSVSPSLRAWMAQYKTHERRHTDAPDLDTRWSRASKGWRKRFV